MQNGSEISPVQPDKTPVYKLRPAAFRLEIAPLSCEPTIALNTPHHISYITQTPFVFSPSGVFMAGDFRDTDVLTDCRGDNPRTTIDEVIDGGTRETARIKREYANLCTALSVCPTPVLAYSSAWPFFDPTTGKYRGYAEFKRFDKFSGMERAAGRTLYLIVYTKWQTLGTGQSGYPQFYVLKPHPIVLDFAAPKTSPADLLRIPHLGIEKANAVRFLDRAMQFLEKKDESGFLIVSAQTPDGKIRVCFKCINDKVVAASIAIPTTNPSQSETETAILKHAVLIRFMLNLVPEGEWDKSGKNPFPQVMAGFAKSPDFKWAKRIGEKFIFASRETHPGFVAFGILNVQIGTGNYDIGNF